jgi:ribosome-associated protein
MKEFSLNGSEFIALCDLMKLLDFAPTSGVAKHLIADGLVSVDGVVETRKRCKIRSGQKISFDQNEARVVG